MVSLLSPFTKVIYTPVGGLNLWGLNDCVVKGHSENWNVSPIRDQNRIFCMVGVIVTAYMINVRCA